EGPDLRVHPQSSHLHVHRRHNHRHPYVPL
ncbi:MAG: hypothetical protein AVDCRST_MAG37-3331, partial [uncultured Rubrobacteraceae bacterium]